MLDKTRFLQHGAVPHQPQDHPPLSVTGRNVAHGHRSKAERLLLGADLHLDRVRMITPTIKQCAALVDVCVPYIMAGIVIADDQAARKAVLAHKISILEAVKAHKRPAETLIEHLKRATPKERLEALLEAAREMGPAAVWDHILAPLI